MTNIIIMIIIDIIIIILKISSFQKNFSEMKNETFAIYFSSINLM